jgi:hypothetical protein
MRQILFIMPIKCLFIALLFIFCSCSFIEKTTYFDSGENSNWERKTLTRKISTSHTETFVLNDSANNKIGSISLKPYFVKPLFFGPPFVPACPLFLFRVANYSGNFSINGEIIAFNIQQLNDLLNDSTGTIIINEKIKLPVTIKPFYDYHSGLSQVFENVRRITITCNYPAKKVKSFRVIPSNYLLTKAFADTKFTRKRKVLYDPFFFDMH